MKIAVIADIHGNAPALEAVLNDLARENVDQIVNLGDAFNGPIDPVGVAVQLQSRRMIHIRGNGERMVVSENPTERKRSATFARDRLSPDQLNWIKTWPALYEGDDFFACHGSPTSDVEYLLEKVTATTVGLRPPSEIQASLGQVKSSLVLCAHSHIPRLVQLNNVVVMNPGSVGLPAYSDDSPVRHKMEVGSPSARYAIAESHRSGWRISHIAVPYDHEKAASVADHEGFADWAYALKSGHAR